MRSWQRPVMRRRESLVSPSAASPKRRMPLSLRQMLTLPYVGLVLVLVLLVGGLSYRTGRTTVDSLSGHLLQEAVSRIAVQLESHVGGADEVLETAFPAGLPPPRITMAELDPLRLRLWQAASLHRDPNNYVYYGDQQGHFAGLWRFSAEEAELRLRTAGTGPRTLYRVSGITGALREGRPEEQVFEPRERPWYQSAMATTLPWAWSTPYVDFKTKELIVTRTHRLADAAGMPVGVAATDLPLRQVNAFLSRLNLSRQSVALVVERDGQLIGVSRGPHLKDGGQGGAQRLNAADSADPLVSGAFAAVRGSSTTQGTAPSTGTFTAPDGQLVQFGHARIDPALGLDWLIIVAMPRNDFLADVQRNFLHTGLLAALAALVAVAIGWTVLNTVSRELRELASAARRVGEGVLDVPPEVHRNDELGELARAFADMQQRLLTDQLTGLSNRAAILRRIEDRILQHRRRGDASPFAVLFVDFDRFKDINDRWGHDAGDAVLQELSQRLRFGVRVGDLVARYAGDEFVLLVESIASRADAQATRAHLEASLREPLQSLARWTTDTRAHGASIGVAMYPEDGQDTETLLRYADADMYRRKAAVSDASPPSSQP